MWLQHQGQNPSRWSLYLPDCVEGVRPIRVHHVYSKIPILWIIRDKRYPPSRYRRGRRRGGWGMCCSRRWRGCRRQLLCNPSLRRRLDKRLGDPSLHCCIDIRLRQSLPTRNQPSGRHRNARRRDHPKHEGFSSPKMPPSPSYHTYHLPFPSASRLTQMDPLSISQV